MAVASGGGGRRRRKTLRDRPGPKQGQGGIPPDLLEGLRDQMGGGADRGTGARSRSITPEQFRLAPHFPQSVRGGPQPPEGAPFEYPVNQVPMPEDMQGVMASLAGGIGASEPAAPPVLDGAISSLASALPQQMPEMDDSRRRILQMLAQQFGGSR